MIDTQSLISKYYLNAERQLPNGGGSYNVADAASPNSTNRLFSTDQPNTKVIPGGDFYPAGTPYSMKKEVESPQAPQVDLYAKYRDPKTGDIMSPEEYAIYLGNKVPQQKSSGDIGQYAGDAMMYPDESSQDLTARARNMNNARNDIATGTTDPYKVGSKSGIAYSPQELAAIEKAYAGIYDPALNDVFARLKTREEESKRLADREDKIFSTNEAIRQWQVTTGTKSSGASDELFTDSNILDGASKAKMTPEEFETLVPELKNYYVNPPKVYDNVEGKEKNVSLVVSELTSQYKNGDLTKDEVVQEITNIGLSEEVTAYLIGQLPMLSEDEKKGYWSRLFGAIFGQ